MKAQTHVFHLRCFVCTVCCQQLQKGDQFVIKAGQLFCRADYEKELYMMQQASPRGQTRVEFIIIFKCFNFCSDTDSNKISCNECCEFKLIRLLLSIAEGILDENSRPRDGRRGPKRPRTILTSAQRRQFKASFEVSPKPCRKVS